MELVDICFNFAHDAFRADEHAVLRRAVEAGVTRLLCTGSDLEDSERSVALAEHFPEHLYATVGVHPHRAVTWDAATADALRRLAVEHPRVRAIGEAGLDFNRDYSPRDRQEQAFEGQLELAIELGLPLFLHEREAHERFIAILRRYRHRIGKAVVHCFTGTEAELLAYLDLDLHIGITGWICDERRGHHLREFIHHIPPHRLMIETDAPYLLPRDLHPKPRSRRNEPMYLPHILQTIATAVDRPVSAIAKETTATARAFYRL
ncbi:TatD family hydrolase [Acidihalobacter ferrooxydans]|uniref:Hydrolase TatD n=1 Tax=Acidihalobacter ferrooxydans TaxID=1765967 RepID=A0A1P8UEI7_9GAMM|nr:TatD family hydrolase [Acidihalobacter ferrooxydans]APZ42209.1 hydrolase TatD [Acidihalobacter ferrooxydans]